MSRGNQVSAAAAENVLALSPEELLQLEAEMMHMSRSADASDGNSDCFKRRYFEDENDYLIGLRTKAKGRRKGIGGLLLREDNGEPYQNSKGQYVFQVNSTSLESIANRGAEDEGLASQIDLIEGVIRGNVHYCPVKH